MPFAPPATSQAASSDAAAAAAGHCNQMPMDEAPDRDTPAVAGTHGCIGCLVPQFGVPETPVPVRLIASLPMSKVTNLTGTSTIPEPPPPKA